MAQLNIATLGGGGYTENEAEKRTISKRYHVLAAPSKLWALLVSARATMTRLYIHICSIEKV